MSRPAIKLKSSRGSSNVVIICILFFIILLSAFAVDIGYIALERYRLTKKVEDAALTGVQLLQKSGGQAMEQLKSNVLKQVTGLTRLEIRIPDDRRAITIEIEKPVDYFFLSRLGYEKKRIETDITVKVSGVKKIRGVRPFAIQKRQMVYENRFVLRSWPGPKGESTVIYTPVDFGGRYYRNHILYGYMSDLSTGDGIRTAGADIGDMAEVALKELIGKCSHEPECTYLHHSQDCPRIIILPVIDKIDADGEGMMKVLGFTAFFLEESGTDTSGTYIAGRFIRHAVKAGISDDVEDFGLVGARLIK